MKLGKICKWEDLEIGEVFACDGCLTIAEKSSENTAFILATTYELEDYCQDKRLHEQNDSDFNKVIGRNVTRQQDNFYNWVEYRDFITRFKIFEMFSLKSHSRELLFKLSKTTQELWKTTR